MSPRSLLFLGFTFLFWRPLVLAAAGVTSDDYEGAPQLVQQLNVLQNKPAQPTASLDETAQLTQDLLAFPNASANLTPAEAAQKWLALFDRALALKAKASLTRMFGSQIRGVFDALPGPRCWPELQRQAETRPEVKTTDPQTQAQLLLILHTLNHDEPKQWADLTALLAIPDNTRPPQNFQVLVMGARLSGAAQNPDAVEKFWNQAFDGLEKGPVAVTSNSQTESFAPDMDMGAKELELPDLVTILGAARAEPLLLRALLLSKVKTTAVRGIETRRLMRKLALAHLDAIQQPPWILTESMEATSLYEALQKKFPADKDAKKGAIYYVLSLAVQGKADDAVKAAANIDLANLDSAVDEAIKAGWGPPIYDFLHAYLGSHPEAAMWKTYVSLAAQTGHASEALQFVHDTLARADLNDAARAQARPVLYAALLAVDRVDDGVAQLRLLIEATQKTPAVIAANDPMQYMTVITRVEWNLELARIGHVLKKSDLETEGLQDARLYLKNLDDHSTPQQAQQAQFASERVISYLLETGQNSEAEKMLIEAIVDAARQAKANASPWGFTPRYPGLNQTGENLVKLAQVYYNAGRWTDILTLLRQVPGWNVVDLAEIADQRANLGHTSTPCLGLMAARALAETGHADEALPILDYVLQIDAGDDAAYALLLKIGHGDLVAKLDALYQEDQFQERPLIWKGVVLLQQGKVAEAEAACKAAIAVDPSDGEEGKGDRMRVYSVMADVCDAKHDAQQATFFRNVVKAIRLSENADDFYAAGLLTRAVGMYSDALNLFSDAYCIQSRLARQLAELGRAEEAAVHYRKAFELMPVSFGRMESHCFGCERAFKGRTAVEIAEKTFSDMLAKDPKKPQLPYLLGYLHMEEGQYPEALVNFQKATELDPDYINAWKQIMEIGQNYRLDPDLGDAAVFNVLRLDPAGRHISPETTNVRQLTKLWDVEAAAGEAVVPAPKSLMELTAARSEIDAQEAEMKNSLSGSLSASMRVMMRQQFSRYVQRKVYEPIDPCAAILKNGIISGDLDLFR